ncbi:MAG TPA: peptide ABC transporter substrate-binding protein [Steroidobacteraceae bacterium]|nr:peptide ABC transporter substrate-binding protein [Steroidobacteraceae bacterium]
MMRAGVAALAAMLAAGAALSGCGGDAGDASLHELRRGNGSEPDSIDPQLARMEAAMTILRDCYEGLVSMDRDGTPVPGAAEGWTLSPDGRRYTFRLRADARWSNGDRVVAEDFAVAWRRLVDPATASQYALMLEPVANATEIVAGRKPVSELGVAAPDEATLVVDLAEPSPYFLAMLSHPSSFPVHRPTLAADPQSFARPGVAVTNGAFVPAEWAIGSHIRAARNRRYWNDAATRLDVVRYVHVADPATELTRFRAGDLDVTYTVPPGEVTRLRQALPGQLHVAPTVGVYYYGFALDLPPFRDAPKLRQALAMAVDRGVLATQVLGDGEQPAYGWVPPGIAAYVPQRFDWSGLDAAARIEAAKRLYAEAGYSAAKPLRVTLRTSKSPLHDRIALAVTAMWKQHLGAEVSLRSEDFRVLKAAIDAREAPLYRGSWIGDYNDAYSFLQVLKGGFGINLPRYASDPYDVALAMAAVAQGGERATYLAAAERQLLADVPLIPLYFYVSKHLVAPRVEGWYDNVMNVTYSKDLAVRATKEPKP